MQTQQNGPAPQNQTARWWNKYFGAIWSNSDFRKLWLSLTITHFGGQVTFLALPLTAAIMLHATPFQMGVLTAVEALPYTLFGLFTGVLIDRSRKLRLIVLADIGRGAALLLVPIAVGQRSVIIDDGQERLKLRHIGVVNDKGQRLRRRSGWSSPTPA